MQRNRLFTSSTGSRRKEIILVVKEYNLGFYSKINTPCNIKLIKARKLDLWFIKKIYSGERGLMCPACNSHGKSIILNIKPENWHGN